MRRRFGWGLPPGVSNRMIEEQARAFEEEEMAQGMEKLVEEIADGFKEMDINEYEPYQLEGRVRWAITRIGKAYADGELELPGEAGRAYIVGFISDAYGDIAIMPGDDMDAHKGDLLIALRKEEQQSNMPRYCEHCGSEEHYTSEH